MSAISPIDLNRALGSWNCLINNYFSLSYSYSLIETDSQSDRWELVKEPGVKNLLVTALKVASYLTIIIPMIVLISDVVVQQMYKLIVKLVDNDSKKVEEIVHSTIKKDEPIVEEKDENLTIEEIKSQFNQLSDDQVGLWLMKYLKNVTFTTPTLSIVRMKSFRNDFEMILKLYLKDWIPDQTPLFYEVANNFFRRSLDNWLKSTHPNLSIETRREVTEDIELCIRDNSSVLDLSRKGIQSLPKAIILLVGLEYIKLNHNCFVEFPDELHTLRNLKRIDLTHNSLKKVLIDDQNFERLNILNLNNNQLSDFSFKTGQSKSLRFLNLMNNKLSELPKTIYQNQSLEIEVDGNPLNT